MSELGLKVTPKQILLLAMVFHCFAAYYSFGYHHPDEHYQILEFANVALGNATGDHLPWEYKSQIRPWLQPYLFAGFFKFLEMFGITSPVAWSNIARILLTVLNWIAIYSLFQSVRARLSESGRTWYWWVTAGLWFFPYIHARTSSENLSALALTFGFAQFLRIDFKEIKYYTRNILYSGLAFGFAFVFRYQVALGLIPLYLWILWMHRSTGFRVLLKHSLGFFFIFGLGVIADRMGYGNWVFTPWRYFHVNLVEGVAATFNPYPFYQYFIWILELYPLFSLPIFAAVLFCFRVEVLRPISIFTFAFFLLHCFMTNKEYRFLLPVLNFAPLWIAFAYDGISNGTERAKKWSQRLRPRKALMIALIALSFPAIYASSFRPANVDFWWHFAATKWNDGLHPWITNNSFQPTSESRQQFYHVAGVPMIVASTPEEIERALIDHPNSWVAIDLKADHEDFEKFISVIQKYPCRLTDSSLPLVWQAVVKHLDVGKRTRVQRLYQCRAQ